MQRSYLIVLELNIWCEQLDDENPTLLSRTLLYREQTLHRAACLAQAASSEAIGGFKNSTFIYLFLFVLIGKNSFLLVQAQESSSCASTKRYAQ